MTPEQSPLGKAVVYTEQYDPTLLFPIERKSARDAIGIGARLPFFGTDIWNAYELSWLNRRGKPQIAVATFFVPAESPNIVESKSFKLYLGSFAQTAFDSIDDVRAADQARCVGDLRRECFGASGRACGFRQAAMEEFDGLSLDRLDLDTDVYSPDPSLLKAVHDEAPVDETLFSNLLKSNCPVTGQPDWGSVQIHYYGGRSIMRVCCGISFLIGNTPGFMSNASSGFSWMSCGNAGREACGLCAVYAAWWAGYQSVQDEFQFADAG